MRFIEAFNDRKTTFQPSNPVSALQWAGGWRDFWGFDAFLLHPVKPLLRSIIEQFGSIIAQMDAFLSRKGPGWGYIHGASPMGGLIGSPSFWVKQSRSHTHEQTICIEAFVCGCHGRISGRNGPRR
jgi:hypothetical protein